MAISDGQQDAGSGGEVGRVFEWSSYGRPCFGERLSGDVALAVEVEGRLMIILIDVLGHGAEAYELAKPMADYAKDCPSAQPTTMLSNLHERFKGSRGSVAGCAILNPNSGEVAYVGVGNPCFRIFGKSRSLLLPASAGTIGSKIGKLKVHHAKMQPKDVLIACSDGVSERFGIPDYPQLLSHGVWAVARNVVRRFGKEYDDATCLVVCMVET